MMVALRRGVHPEVVMESSQLELTRAILQYLMEHNEAADTTEGILRWWILNENLKERMTRVQAALDWLINKGWIERRSMPGMTEPLYLLDCAKLDQIQSWLNGIQ
jgi:hypothetical protein